jgi:hypothetical protein
VSDAAAAPGSDTELTLSLAEAHGVPAGELRFALLCRVRAARAAATPDGRRAAAARRLAALYTLLQLGPDHGARVRTRRACVASRTCLTHLSFACVLLAEPRFRKCR